MKSNLVQYYVEGEDEVKLIKEFIYARSRLYRKGARFGRCNYYEC